VSGGEIALLTGLMSGGFALLGGTVTNRYARRRDDTAFRRETALELAGMERLIWGESWVDLEVELQRQGSRLAVAGVPDDLIQAFRAISQNCWHYLDADRAISPDGEGGISSGLLRTRERVHSAIRAYLLKNETPWKRKARRVEAITATRLSLEDPYLREKLRGRNVIDKI
jgi:hypothetical protein